MTTPGYEILPHPSDVGFAVWAPDFAGLVHQAVRALADVETGGNIPVGDGTRELPAVAEDEDGLVATLERCLLELDVDDWLAVGVVDGKLVGALLDQASKDNGTHVKAITWHQLSLVRESDGLRATVFVDL